MRILIGSKILPINQEDVFGAFGKLVGYGEGINLRII